MPLRNSAEAYGSLSKFLHWAIVLLILPQYFIAEAAEHATEGSGDQAALMGWHISIGLLVLILAQPLSGWVMASAGGAPVGLFGWFDFPALSGENHDLHETLEDVHEFLFNALLVVAAIHVVAALYHHFVLRDATLRRMLPFTRA